MEVVMPEQVILPLIGVFGPLLVATIAAYMLLNRDPTHSGGKR